jgi:hypothetical protein
VNKDGRDIFFISLNTYRAAVYWSLGEFDHNGGRISRSPGYLKVGYVKKVINIAGVGSTHR